MTCRSIRTRFDPDRRSRTAVPTGRGGSVVFGGASLSHDLAARDRLELVGGLLGVAVGQQVLRGERLGVTLLRVESQQQRRAPLHHAPPGVAPAVYLPLVPLGAAEPPLHLQVVTRRSRASLAPDRHEQPRTPAL